MSLQELGALHGANVPPPATGCSAAGAFAAGLCLNEGGADELCEAVSCPIQAAFHRPQVAPGDFSDLLVALPLELAENEHLPVVFRQPLDALVDRILQEPFAVQIVRTRGRVLELQRPMIRFPVLLDGLEQHQRVAAAVAQLVLREVGRDGVDPGREFLGLIETMQMAKDPDENLLHEVFSPLAVTDGAIDEIEEAGLVTVHQGAEGLRLAGQVTRYNLPIIQVVQRFALQRSLRIDGGTWMLQCGRHEYPCVSNGNREKNALIHLMRT